MKRFVTITFAATVLTAGAASVSAMDVQKDLDAKITSGTGIFSGLAGETVLVHVFYDTDLDERFSGTPIVDQFLSFDPPSNAGLTMGVEIEAGGIVRSTVAAGVADHDISIQDTAQLDQWSIDTVNVLSPISQVSITLRGNTSFVSPGDGGLTGMPIFPPDYCAASLAAIPLAIGNFTAYAGGQLEGSLTYDFLQGPTCSPPAALCGDANGDLSVSATDALITLNASIGLGNCEICVCDVNGSGGVTASDASVVLAAAVGQPVALACDPCGAQSEWSRSKSSDTDSLRDRRRLLGGDPWRYGGRRARRPRPPRTLVQPRLRGRIVATIASRSMSPPPRRRAHFPLSNSD